MPGFIIGNSTLSGMLLKPLDSLTADQQNVFGMLVQFEDEALKVGNFLIANAVKFASIASKELFAKLSGNDELTEEQKLIVEEIFGKTVYSKIVSIPESLTEDLKEGKGLLFNAMLSKRVISVLEGIVDFKKSIDDKFPGLSDMILKLANVAITTVVTMINPTVGLCLKATKVLDRATDFLKTDNLEATLNKLKEKYEEVQQDKELSKEVEKAEKISNLSSLANVSALALLNANINDAALENIMKNVNHNLQVREFVSHIAEYSEKYIPNSQQEVSAKTTMIKETIMTEMQKHNISVEVMRKCEATIEQSIKETNKLLESSLDADKNFFAKLAVQQKATKTLLDLSEELKRTLEKSLPEARDKAQAITTVIAYSIKENIQGPVEKIQSDIAQSNNAKIAKEMGANLAVRVIMESSITQFNKGIGVATKISNLDGRSV